MIRISRSVLLNLTTDELKYDIASQRWITVKIIRINSYFFPMTSSSVGVIYFSY